VLEFPQSAIAAGTSGPSATVELGQPNLTSTYSTTIGAGTTNGMTITDQFAVPLALGFDGSGNLFVSDSDTSTRPISAVSWCSCPPAAFSARRLPLPASWACCRRRSLPA